MTVLPISDRIAVHVAKELTDDRLGVLFVAEQGFDVGAVRAPAVVADMVKCRLLELRQGRYYQTEFGKRVVAEWRKLVPQ